MTVTFPRWLLGLVIVALAGAVVYLLLNSNDDGPVNQIVKPVQPCPAESLAGDDGSCVTKERIDFYAALRRELQDQFYDFGSIDCILGQLDHALSDASIAIAHAEGGGTKYKAAEFNDELNAADAKCIDRSGYNPNVPAE